MDNKDIAHHLQFTSNMKKPTKNQVQNVLVVNLFYLVFSNGSQILIFTPMILTCTLAK